jgi:hypothetical protein
MTLAIGNRRREGRPMTDENENSGSVPDGGNPREEDEVTRAASLLNDVRRLRRQTKTARHAYWLPLLLFGLLTCGSAPFYIQPTANCPASAIGQVGPGYHAVHVARHGACAGSVRGSVYLPGFGGFLGNGWRVYLALYWVLAIAAGLTATYVWYRRRGRQVGLVTPARGFLITGVVVSLLVLVLPTVGLVPGDLVIRGTLPLLIIAAGLWTLARAERSRALLVVAAVYTGTALLASLYNIENVLFRLGWNPAPDQWQLTSLPNVLLPALVLLAAGTAAFMVQRRARRTA